MKLLEPFTHGVLDYALAIAFLITPTALRFESDAARMLAHAIGITYILASFLTRYPAGGIKLIPFPVHGVLETIAAVSWIAMPFIFGFGDDTAARNFFIVAGIALLAMVAVTDYRAGERRSRRPDRRLHLTAVRQERRIALFPRRRMDGARDAVQL